MIMKYNFLKNRMIRKQENEKMKKGIIFVDPLFLEQCRENFLSVYTEAYPDRDFGQLRLTSIIENTLGLASRLFEDVEWTIEMPAIEELSATATDMSFQPFDSGSGRVVEFSRPAGGPIRFSLEERIMACSGVIGLPMILMIGSEGPDYLELSRSSGDPGGLLQQRGDVFWLRDSEQPNPLVPAIPWQSYVYVFGPSYGLRPEEL
jgi:hypothetical protein